jgi:hypothetical protein
MVIAVAKRVMELQQLIQEKDQKISELEIALDEEGPTHRIRAGLSPRLSLCDELRLSAQSFAQPYRTRYKRNASFGLRGRKHAGRADKPRPSIGTRATQASISECL